MQRWRGACRCGVYCVRVHHSGSAPRPACLGAEGEGAPSRAPFGTSGCILTAQIPSSQPCIQSPANPVPPSLPGCSLQEEEDRKLAEAEARLQERLQELEAAEAAEAAEGEERPRRGLGFGWPFSRRHPPSTFSAGGGPPAQAAGTTGPRSRGRRSRWGGGPSFVDTMAGLLGTSGLGHRGGGAGYGGGGFGGHAPPHLPLALQQAMMGAQRSALPPQLLFRQVGMLGGVMPVRCLCGHWFWQSGAAE